MEWDMNDLLVRDFVSRYRSGQLWCTGTDVGQETLSLRIAIFGIFDWHFREADSRNVNHFPVLPVLKKTGDFPPHSIMFKIES
jgi:hypothetical protein